VRFLQLLVRLNGSTLIQGLPSNVFLVPYAVLVISRIKLLSVSIYAIAIKVKLLILILDLDFGLFPVPNATRYSLPSRNMPLVNPILVFLLVIISNRLPSLL